MSQLLKKKLRESSSQLLSAQHDFSRQKDYDFSSLQADEEIKEITVQLVMIRKAYDNILHDNSQKRAQIEIMKKQISKLQDTTTTYSEDQSSIGTRMNKLQNQLDLLRYKLEEEHQSNKTYDHMLARMKVERIGLEVKSTALHDNLGSFKGHLNEYMQKSRKNKEESVQSQRILRGLKEELRAESKNKEDFIKRLEVTARSKKEASIRRQERIKKQAEIAEAAANENRNAEEIALKQEIILHKLYFMFLKYKQEKDFKESEDAEEAFRSIRVATGISSVQTVVEGFLRKEELSVQLNTSISESQKQLSMLKKRNEKVRNELNKMLLMSQESTLPYNQKLLELQSEIDKQQKSYEKSVEENSMNASIIRQVKTLSTRFKRIIKIPESNDLVSDYKQILESVKTTCAEVASLHAKYMQNLESKNNTKILALFKSLHPSKVKKPKYLHDLSDNEHDQEFITLEED